MGKTFVEDERPCDQCVNRTRYGCASWDCKFIDRDEAIKAWKEKHDKADRKTENSSEKPNNCEDEFKLYDREDLIALIEAQRERIGELLKDEPQERSRR